MERREALVSLRKAADIINATVQVRHHLQQNIATDSETAFIDLPVVSRNPMLYNHQRALRNDCIGESAVVVLFH